ncbi:MAG TPA: zf-HC2 domain-containing protein [Terriglobales bacterium]|jgi:hypothetical protein|nr:zf-HC2 domain-containing protein [Terriglobales bacterium]
MKCARVKALISAYVDGAVTGTEMRILDEHLGGCEECQMAYREVRQTQLLLAQAARRKAPRDLSLKLRVAISREIAHRRDSTLRYMLFRLDNATRAFVVPATAGLVTAVLIFGIFMGFSALPLQAGNADVPLMLSTAPQLEQSSFGNVMGSVSDDSLVIEAYVNSSGRVEDYRILSESGGSRDLTPQVKNMLIDLMTFTTFRPATSMGSPTPGRAILSFSKVSVKG